MRRRGRSGAPGAGAAPGGDPRADRLELRRHLAEQALDERGGVRRPERQEAGDPDKILERLCGGAEGLAAGDVVCAGDERVEPVELVADVGFGSDRAHLVLPVQGWVSARAGGSSRGGSSNGGPVIMGCFLRGYIPDGGVQ